MTLTEMNYYSQEMNKKYLSVSQFKSFVGTPFEEACERKALAELNGEYVREKSDALLIGSYVDTSLTGTEKDMSIFKANNPEIFSSRGPTKGRLKSTYKKANFMIDRVRKDKLMMKTLSGEHQVIMTGTIFGADWKIKIDSLLPNAIVDLKTVESINKSYYSVMHGRRVSFVEYFDYILQGAIYQEVVRQNTGKKLPFFLSAVSKEPVPDIAVIQIDNATLEEKLESIETYVEPILALKKGDVEPTKCGHCDFCKEHKVLKSPINWLEIGGELR